MILSNLDPSIPDKRDYLYTNTGINLPESVDLRKLDREGIEDQLKIGSCTANATTSAFELMDSENKQYSRLFNYYTSRELLKIADRDDGSTIKEAVHAAYKHGIPSEDVWPYDTTKVFTRPSDEAYLAARGMSAIRYEKLWDIYTTNRLGNPQKMLKVRECLAQGLPVIFGGAVSRNFGADMRGKTFEQQNYRYDPERDWGNHAMLFVGYQNPYVLILENSWGTGWGDNGYALWSEDMMQQVFECYVIREIGMDDIELTIGGMSDESFKTMVDGARSDPKWAAFLRYLDRAGGTRQDAINLCKTLKFTKMTQLVNWVQS